MTIDRPGQVWAADITYVPVGKGFLYLVAVIDWASRAVLSWRLSNTMDASFCVEALEEALARYGRPEIFNTDQGSQFTGAAFTGVLTAAGVRISMDGRGRWMDNRAARNSFGIHRAALALAQIRRRLPQGLRRRRRCESRHWRVARLLQRTSPSSGARLSSADGDLSRRRRGRDLWTWGQCAPMQTQPAAPRIDHMPTGGAETAAGGIFSGLKKTHPADGLPT